MHRAEPYAQTLSQVPHSDSGVGGSTANGIVLHVQHHQSLESFRFIWIHVASRFEEALEAVLARLEGLEPPTL